MGRPEAYATLYDSYPEGMAPRIRKVMYRLVGDLNPEPAEEWPLIVCERMGAVSWPTADLAFATYLEAYAKAGGKVVSVSAYARPWIRTLPEDLVVEGDITLDGCALESLPKGLSVRGHLSLRGCSAWDGIIPDVGELLAARGIHPASFGTCAMGVSIERAKALIARFGFADIVDAIYEVGGTGGRLRELWLVISGNESVAGLAGLKMVGTLSLKDYSLGRTPEGMAATDMFQAGCVTGLEAAPADLVCGKITYHGCRGLESIPDGFRGTGALTLNRCESLRRLPDGMTIGVAPDGCDPMDPWGSRMSFALDLNGCRSLAALPAGLVVRGNVDLRGCSAWDRMISGDADNDGRILTDDFPTYVSILDAGTDIGNYRAWMVERGIR